MAKVVKKAPVAATESRAIVGFTWRMIFQTLIIGAIVGLVTWVLTVLLRHYVFEPLLCHTMTSVRCSSAPTYAAAFGQVIAALVALFALVRVLAYRPLLGVIAATLALWNVVMTTGSWTWWAALIACIVLYALAYALFMLLARLRSMILAVVVMVMMIVIVRLVLRA